MKEQTILDVQALRTTLWETTGSLYAAYKEYAQAKIDLKHARDAAESAETIIIYEESCNPASPLKSGKNAEERKLALDNFLIGVRNGKLKPYTVTVSAAEVNLANWDVEIKNLEAKVTAIKADLNACIAILGVLSA